MAEGGFLAEDLPFGVPLDDPLVEKVGIDGLHRVNGPCAGNHGPLP